ncbi:hypothetical protein J31TS4_01830 [Paenibacillus sp. J31TS4]|uniref:HD domain-containing protein n=1 Tax=Paenibacillus sp. J31TS4 TaxID=2807195 RepID=UPI001B1F3C32|nr:HD domain-containing protein [Paenibacillus sp. J31TS4]GIP36903.1 hypothetical protein J31TS4_01830 [Paenibacillus sp. J31TS4]
MNRDKLKEMAYHAMGKRKAHIDRERGFIYYHCGRTAKLALTLRESLFPDMADKDDVIFAGALFHDVAKGIEPHNERGALLVGDMLKHEVSSSELADIVAIVRGHNKRKPGDNGIPYFIKLVQDADVLDHFGSAEVWLKVQYSATHGETMQEAAAFWNSESYEAEVRRWRGLLNYELSLRHFDEKTAFVSQFIHRFTREAEGELVPVAGSWAGQA